jgi:SNF2 family DNA or RNA helicase
MGTLSYLNSKYYFAASCGVERDEAMKAGLSFESDTLRWVTRSHAKARLLRRYADGSAERKLKNYFITDLTPPEFLIYPDHLAPRSWQVESAWHVLTRTPSYVADEAGLGKTATAIIAVNSSPGKTLITCPPYLRYNWLSELKTWLNIKVLGAAHINHGRSKPHQWIQLTSPTFSIVESGDSDASADILILPDSLLTSPAIRSLLKRHAPFKWLIVDEAHRFKTDDAQRTKALVGDEKEDGITALAERTVLLSGTPIPNGRPIELYPVLSRLAPESILHRSLEEYWKDFCGGKSITRYEGQRAIVNRNLQGTSNLKQLRKELRRKFTVRHLKKNCLKELGPKTRQIIFLNEPGIGIKALEKEILTNHELEDLIGENYNLGDIARYRREVGEVKQLPALRFIKDKLDETGEKIVVAAYHIETVNFLHKHLLKDYGALKIQGGMSAADKAEAVRLFQTKESRRVMVGNTLAMGLGNTLTKAPIFISVEPEWTPGTNEQMEDRIHRISQEKHVYCIYLVLRNSLDERMLHRALGKEENIQTVMN